MQTLHAESRPGPRDPGLCSGGGRESSSPLKSACKRSNSRTGDVSSPSVWMAIEADALKVVQGRLPYPRPHRSAAVPASLMGGKSGQLLLSS